MLYVLIGDSQKTGPKVNGLVAALRKKKPDAHYVRVTLENIQEISLDELLFSQGLFEPKGIIVLDGVLSAAPEVLERIAELAGSEHVCIIREEKVDAKTKKKFEKHAEKLQEFDLPPKAEAPDMFALPDALAQKDRKRAWVLLQEAFKDGRAPEELHGMLLWQFRALLAAKNTDSAEEAGMKQFPYSKAKRSLANWGSEELDIKSRALLTLFSRSRARGEDAETALERFVLSV